MTEGLFPTATTQPTAQNNSKQLGWSGIIIGKKNVPYLGSIDAKPPQPPHHHHDVITF